MNKKLLYFTCIFLTSIQIGFAEDTFVGRLEKTYPNHKIELMFRQSPNEESKAIFFFHGAQGDGLKTLSLSHLNHWTKKGYTVVSISMPGWGESTGERDFCGPFTMNSLNLAIDKVKKELNIKKLALIGYGQGGVAATLLSAQRDDVCCTISSNGGYDLLKHKTPDDFLFSTLKEKNYKINLNDDEALKYRSAICHISSISAPLFLLHRKDHPAVNHKEATDFYEAMLAAGKECYLVIKEKASEKDDEKISYNEVLEETESWLDNHMK